MIIYKIEYIYNYKESVNHLSIDKKFLNNSFFKELNISRRKSVSNNFFNRNKELNEEEIHKMMNIYLNKLTNNNFNIIYEKLCKLIKSQKIYILLIDKIIEKSLLQKNYSVIYSNLLLKLKSKTTNKILLAIHNIFYPKYLYHQKLMYYQKM